MEELQLPRKKVSKIKTSKSASDKWFGIDLSAQGIRNIADSLLNLGFIKELHLNNNEIEVIPKDIYKLKELEILNLSKNKIKCIPPELGKAVSLKELRLSDNLITNIPMELGTLYNLEVLDINSNPLTVPFDVLVKEKKLLIFCREHNTSYPKPSHRVWMDCFMKKGTGGDCFTVGTYNILCNFYASKLTYPPAWILNSDLRKENILQEIVSINVDILGLQEIETSNYFEFYKDQLDLRCNYDSAFFPKSRSKTLNDKRNVDGCAIFYRKNKFNLIEQFNIDFGYKAKFEKKLTDDLPIMKRLDKKDNVALCLVLEMLNRHQLVVCNVHTYWDPEYADIKLFQVLLLLEELQNIRTRYNNAPVILLGDFNSLKSSDVYNAILGILEPSKLLAYPSIPYTSIFMHSMKFSDSYEGQNLTFTNFTPTFKETIDYIFYNANLRLTSTLSPVEEEYTENTVGFPNIHFPSDHIFIASRFQLVTKFKNSKNT